MTNLIKSAFKTNNAGSTKLTNPIKPIDTREEVAKIEKFTVLSRNDKTKKHQQNSVLSKVDKTEKHKQEVLSRNDKTSKHNTRQIMRVY